MADNTLTKSDLIDKLDLMRDEFTRISTLTQDSEILGLCHRAIEDIGQRIPVLDQRDRAVSKLDRIKGILSERT